MLTEVTRKVGEIQEHVMSWKPGMCFKKKKGVSGACASKRSNKVKNDMSIEFGNRKVIYVLTVAGDVRERLDEGREVRKWGSCT